MRRSIGVLVALNVLLAGGIALTRPAPERERPTFALPALAVIDRIEIQRTGQRDVALVREGAAWTVSGAPIDPYALAALEAALSAPVGADQAVALAGADEDAFGVGEHALTVTFVSGAGRRTVRIGKGQGDRRTFVRPLDEAVIYRARADLRTAFDRPATHWRERRLFNRAPEEIAVLSSTVGERLDWSARRASPDAPWVLGEGAGGAMGEAGGAMGEAGAIEAGQEEINAVANTLATAQAHDFAPPGTPLRTVAMLHAQTFAGETFGLALGPAADDGSRPARVAGSEAVAIVPRHLAVFLAARANDLRERRLFEVEWTAVVEVVIAGAPPIRLVREGSRWRMVTAAGPQGAQPVPAAAVEGWLSGLLSLRAAGFPEAVPADAFAAPVARVGLLLGGDRQIELEVGAAWRGGAHFARTSDRPARVVVIGAGALVALRPAPAMFLAAPEAPAPLRP